MTNMSATEKIEEEFTLAAPQGPSSRWSGYALFAVIAALLLAEPLMLFLLVYRDRVL